MDTQDLVSRLQFFYGLELSQVRMYTLQSEAVTDPYLKQVFRHLASIEQSHVQRIKKEIEKLGEAPAKASEVIGPITGRILGVISGAISVDKLLRMNIELEQRAMEDYRSAINALDPAHPVTSVLVENLIDEDLHTAWFLNRLQ